MKAPQRTLPPAGQRWPRRLDSGPIWSVSLRDLIFSGSSAVLAIAFLLLQGATANAADVGIAWDAPSTYEDGTPLDVVGGYRVYWGTESGQYTACHDAGDTTSTVITGLQYGVTYYMASTAYSATGLESVYSAEIVCLLDPPPGSQFALSILSPHGATEPSTGQHLYPVGNAVSCSVAESPIAAGSTRYACTGWTGTGAAPALGDGTDTGAFLLTTDSTILWHWQTQHQVSAISGPGGVVEGEDWYPEGSQAGLQAMPAPGFAFSHWSGDVPGGMQSDNPLILEVAAPLAVSAGFVVDTNQISATQSCVGFRRESGVAEVSCRFVYPTNETVSLLRWTPQLPSGWELTDANGPAGVQVSENAVVVPQALSGGSVDFQYVASVPAGAAASNALGGSVEFILVGMSAPATVDAGPQSLAVYMLHSADYEAPFWSFSTTEVQRVLAYWRAGGYQGDPSTADGFAALAGGDGALTEATRHCGDFQEPVGVLDAEEVTAILGYWRAGAYEPSPGSSDGYAPPGFKKSAGSLLVSYVSMKAPGQYTPTGTLVLTNTIYYYDTVQALCLRPQLPDGWNIVAVSADGDPELQHGEIVWPTHLPARPAVIEYTVTVPLTDLGQRAVSAEAYGCFSDAVEGCRKASGTKVLESADSDTDGLPDGWEQYFTDDLTSLASSEDTDGDGATNGDECAAGTDPTDRSSVLSAQLGTGAGGSGFTVSWPSVTGRTYAVQRAIGLSAGFSTWIEGIEATPPFNSVTDLAPGAASQFYRVVVIP